MRGLAAAAVAAVFGLAMIAAAAPVAGQAEDPVLSPALCEAIAAPLTIRYPRYLQDNPPEDEAAEKRLLTTPDHMLRPLEAHDAAMLLLVDRPTGPTIDETRRGCRLLQTAAGAKVLKAYAPLGQLYEEAATSPAAIETAAIAYQRGARDGDPLARMLGYALDLRRAETAEAKRAAVAGLRELAARGYALANLPLGEAALAGVEREPDAREASRLIEVAARADWLEAAERLGELYMRGGPNLAPDALEAERWFGHAADLGSAGALFKAGLAVRLGPRTDATTGRAMQWFEAAAKSGSVPAKAWMARLLAYDVSANQRDPARACKLAREAAETGDGAGLYAHFLLLSNGLGCAKDEAAGLRSLRRASDAGDAEAMTELGRRMAYGVGLPQDLAGGKALVERAIPGNPFATCLRGRLELVPTADTEALKRALRWLRPGADLGYPVCLLGLSVAVLNGAVEGTVPQDGIELLRIAASTGDPEAMDQYGVELMTGRHGPRDLVAARKLFEAAAAQGYPSAIGHLALLRQKGWGGLSPDPVTAAKDLERAVALGDDSDALHNLGRAKIEGTATAKDVAGGVALLRRAIATNNPNAAYDLVRLPERGITGPGVPDDAEAFAILNRFAAQNGEVMTALADFHREGRGTPVDLVQAREWYRRSAEAGSIQGANNYGFSLLTGFGGPKDMPEAAKWLKVAAGQGHPNALMSMSALYLTEMLGPPDPVQALAEITLALALNQEGLLDEQRVERATRVRDGLRARMSPEQRGEADRRAALRMQAIGSGSGGMAGSK